MENLLLNSNHILFSQGTIHALHFQLLRGSQTVELMHSCPVGLADPRSTHRCGVVPPPSMGSSSIRTWLWIPERGRLRASSSPEISPAPPVWELWGDCTSRSPLALSWHNGHGEFLLILSFALIEHRKQQCDVNLLLSLSLASETLVLCSNRCWILI